MGPRGFTGHRCRLDHHQRRGKRRCLCRGAHGTAAARGGGNAIGAALLFGKSRIETNDIEGFRKVIDISADSAANFSGPSIMSARDEVVAAGITINGLAVLCRECSGRPINYDLEAVFADEVVGWPGAFVVTADAPATFAEAVRRKLILEIASKPGNPDIARSVD
jgi:hypothetical protein